MTTAAGPTMPGTTSRGSTQLKVTVMSVSGPIAVVIDQTGRQLQIRRDFMRAKGSLPAVGEQWLIDKAINNTWTFALCINPANSIDTEIATMNTEITALQNFQSSLVNNLCLLTLATPQPLSASLDTYATTGWQVESDSGSMATLSTSSSVNSFVTIHQTGLYHLSLRGAIISVSGAGMAGFVTYNAALNTSSIARDNRNSVSAGAEGTWVNPNREVHLVSGGRLYWGFWCSAATTLSAVALGQPTELEVRCVAPSSS